MQVLLIMIESLLITLALRGLVVCTALTKNKKTKCFKGGFPTTLKTWECYKLYELNSVVTLSLVKT